MDRLKAMKEPDGSSVLDNTVLGLSSGMGIGHSKDRLPTILAGGKKLGIAHQGHLMLPTNTPLSTARSMAYHARSPGCSGRKILPG